MTTYGERLYVPLRWWVQAIMLIATLWLALIVAVPDRWSFAITGACIALMAVAFSAYGSALIAVDGRHLRVGPAQIEAQFLGEAVSLDAEESRRTAGVDADVRAFLMLRPYLKRTVKVTITDPADPAPYWLISTRRPDRLAAAITSLTQSTSER